MNREPEQPDSRPASPTDRPHSATGAIGILFARLRDRLARTLLSLHVTPNVLTVVGLILSAAAGVSFAGRTWNFRLGALFVVAAGACDMLDGAVAKLGGRTTRFGAVLDSGLDRYSDGFLFGGLLLHWAYGGNHLLAVLSLSALLGSFAVSYLRARAENLIDSCKVGFWERGERTVLLLIGAVFGCLPTAVLLLGTLTHVTALQRLLHTRDRLEERTYERPAGRLRGPCWWVVHRVVLWDYPRASLPYDVAVALTVAFTLLLPLSG